MPVEPVPNPPPAPLSPETWAEIDARVDARMRAVGFEPGMRLDTPEAVAATFETLLARVRAFPRRQASAPDKGPVDIARVRAEFEAVWRAVVARRGDHEGSQDDDMVLRHVVDSLGEALGYPASLVDATVAPARARADMHRAATRFRPPGAPPLSPREGGS